MDTITVVIRLTGLLLLTPATPSGDRPTHLLMPAVTGTVPHVAQIGFRVPSNPGTCAYFEDRICYVSIAGYDVSLGNAGNARPVSLPQKGGNASEAAGRPVPRQLLGTAPDATLGARVTLHSGSVTGECALGRWNYDARSVELLNMVEWTFSHPARTLELQRTPLGSAPTVAAIPLTPTVTDSLELFIRHVPVTEQSHKPSTKPPVLGDSATHFLAFYDLMGVPAGGKRPVPTLSNTEEFPKTCDWADKRFGPEVAIQAAPGTLSCMIASGTPEP